MLLGLFQRAYGAICNSLKKRRFLLHTMGAPGSVLGGLEPPRADLWPFSGCPGGLCGVDVDAFVVLQGLSLAPEGVWSVFELFLRQLGSLQVVPGA